MAEVALNILIRPGIPPDARHDIEDQLMARLERFGCDVAGGGGMVDGSESDIMLYVDNVPSRLPVVMEILKKARVGRKSLVESQGPTEQKFLVHEDLPEFDPQDYAPAKPWWKFW